MVDGQQNPENKEYKNKIFETKNLVASRLCKVLFVQDIGHAPGGYKPPRVSMSRTPFSLAGFQVITIGRFWVIAEGMSALILLTILS